MDFSVRALAAGLVLAAAAQGAVASGIYSEGIGARALGMGGAFVAVADDSTAVFWNPAGLVQLQGRGVNLGLYSMSTWMKHGNGHGAHNAGADFAPEMGDVFAKVYPSEPHYFDRDKVFWPSAATAPEFTGHWNRGRYTLGFGAFTLGGAYSDYEGEGVDPLSGATVEGSVYSLFGLVDFNSSIGVQVTERLSLGLGLDLLVGYINVEVDKDYLGSANAALPDYRLDVHSDALGYGVQGVFGALYKVHPRLSVGAVYRSGAKMKLEGDSSATLRFLDGNPGNDFDEKSDHRHRFRFPPSWALGLAWRPSDRLLLSFDWNRVDWTRFYWPPGRIKYEHPGAALLKSVNKDPGWFPADSYRMGFEYRLSPQLTWRAGYYKETSGGFPPQAENITYTVSGDMEIANTGVSYSWKNWTGDFLVGTMWGATSEDMEHRCLTLAANFRRSFGR
jgi:long-chain fatty acid transport protein